jgi:hypothetical protein
MSSNYGSFRTCTDIAESLLKGQIQLCAHEMKMQTIAECKYELVILLKFRESLIQEVI